MTTLHTSPSLAPGTSSKHNNVDWYRWKPKTFTIETQPTKNVPPRWTAWWTHKPLKPSHSSPHAACAREHARARTLVNRFRRAFSWPYISILLLFYPSFLAPLSPQPIYLTLYIHNRRPCVAVQKMVVFFLCSGVMGIGWIATPASHTNKAFALVIVAIAVAIVVLFVLKV